MTFSITASRRFLLTAILFEGGLGVVAVILGLIFGPLPWVSITRSAEATWWALGVGLAATVPMVLALAVVDRYPLGPLKELQTLVETHLVPLFRNCSWLELILVAALAGVGEEFLFRGWLQEGLARWIGPPWGWAIGLIVASLLFGVCHWLSTTYAILAAFVGLYFGSLYLLADNLLAPIIAHAAYDFIALVYLVKWKPVVVELPAAEMDDEWEGEEEEGDAPAEP
jgi:membrane protease YdiL (CAAX protease family)